MSTKRPNRVRIAQVKQLMSKATSELVTAHANLRMGYATVQSMLHQLREEGVVVAKAEAKSIKKEMDSIVVRHTKYGGFGGRRTRELLKPTESTAPASETKPVVNDSPYWIANWRDLDRNLYLRIVYIPGMIHDNSFVVEKKTTNAMNDVVWVAYDDMPLIVAFVSLAQAMRRLGLIIDDHHR